MSHKRRIERLERTTAKPGADSQGEVPEYPGIILTWPDDDHNAEYNAKAREHNAKAREWIARHGQPGGPVKLHWPGGREVVGP